MTKLPKDNPLKLSDFLWLNPLQIFMDQKLPQHHSRENTLSVEELMTQNSSISNLAEVGGVISYVRKGNLLSNKSLIWSQLTGPPRKKTAELWSGRSLGWNSCWANRKGILESRAPGFMEWTHRHSASFHNLLADTVDLRLSGLIRSESLSASHFLSLKVQPQFHLCNKNMSLLWQELKLSHQSCRH